ncbi:MAG: FdtA/QdtA family cupin domain-containing protein [Candidatus Levybacteria bacterium]|nr:FdtA/QdtA family cupin domain-containing protein [Candidatus Levybacteria bacterium]
MKNTFALYSLKAIDSPNFTMSPIELKDYIPFEVKRVYFISKSKIGTSGEHCHFIEEELFVLVQGSATIIIDKGQGKEEIAMIGPTSACYVPNYVWHGFRDISPDAIILALSSTNYSPDRSDYLENYDDYLKIRDQKLQTTSA